MLYQTIKSLSGRLSNLIDCIKELQELESMSIIIPTLESLVSKIKKYQKLNDQILFNTQLFCLLEISLQANIQESIKRETIYIYLQEKQEAYHLATLDSLRYFEETLKKSRYRNRSKKDVCTLFR